MDWNKELKSRQQAVEDADSRLREARQRLKHVVVEATNDSAVKIDSVASAAGWSVAYLRALRQKHEASLPRTKNLSASGMSASAEKKIAAARTSVERAERAYHDRRHAMIELIGKITTPAPTMADVAEVLGVSRQRVSQLLDEL